MTSFLRLLGLRSRRFIYFAFRFVGALLNLLPRRLVFFMLVLSDALGLKGRRRFDQAYFPYVTAHLARHPDFRFAVGPAATFKSSSAVVLHGIGAYREACRWIKANRLASAPPAGVLGADIAFALLHSHFELGEFAQASAAVADMPRLDLANAPDLSFLLAMLHIIADDERAAIAQMQQSCRDRPALFRPHQNIAARSHHAYAPNALDRQSGALGHLFDLCNFAGQRATHVGRGDIGVRLYERALDAQARLRQENPPQPSQELSRWLVDCGVPLDRLRLIPEEWSTQIGHLGMLDILFRMQDLGWWSGEPVIVVRRNLIANPAFLSLFQCRCRIVVIGETIPETLAEELLSLQRWCGLNFNAFRLPDGRVVPWQEAGALAMVQWEQDGRGDPLGDAYDRELGSTNAPNETFQRLRQRAGMGPDDWYVCLHTRDAAHYFEFGGTGQTHRNAPIEASFEAIRFVTDKGGWVIKLGGPDSPKLPHLERTIDYALSEFRSDVMDIHLIRHARAFVGTTSGLTNVAISLGIPCAIVNAITTDAQLWNENVRFAPKPVRRADGTMLTQHELTTAPWRWRVFDASVLGRSGAYPQTNSADEILGTVREVVAVAEGTSTEYEAGYQAASLLARWRSDLSVPYYYGAGRISIDFLARYADEFLRAPSRQA